MISFVADLLAIISIFKDPKELLRKFKNLSRRQKMIAMVLLAVIASVVFTIYAIYRGLFVPAITQVMISHDVIDMSTGDSVMLSATVLYADNKENHEVLWVSNHPAVARIDETGRLTAMSAGSATIMAQAANRKSAKSAECIVHVSDPLTGYSISVKRTAVENYVYIYVQPKDGNVSEITIYAKAPSGQIYTPAIDENNLYHFYTETGTWTIYAALKSETGSYEAKMPEDFVTIDINDVSPNAMDALLAGLPVNQ